MGGQDRGRGDMGRLLALLDDARRPLDGYGPRTLARQRGGKVAGDAGSLLEQCMALCAERESRPVEPVRTVHHMACTGGTLISKCLAAMPNVQLLSEVDPLSPVATGKPVFAPTDLIRLLRQGTRGTDDRLAVEVFQAGLAVVVADCQRRGLRLVLRDHAHSHFCQGSDVPERPGLRSIVSGVAPVVSVVTVRHPVDSYLSLRKLGWDTYTPKGLDEYCRRYLAFLDHHAGSPVIRYEDFVAAPARVLRLLCEVLKLPFRDGFEDLIGVFHLTGDSGRRGETIESRPRRPVPGDVEQELKDSRPLAALLQRLGYDE